MTGVGLGLVSGVFLSERGWRAGCCLPRGGCGGHAARGGRLVSRFGSLCGGGQPGAIEATRVKATVSWSCQAQEAGRCSVRRQPERGEVAGDVEQAVAQPFRFRERELALERSSPARRAGLGRAARARTTLCWARVPGRAAGRGQLLRFLDPVLDAGV